MKVTIKNGALEKLLEEKGKNDRDTWASIRDHDGSVRHLDFLSQMEKDVFKTFSEINQYMDAWKQGIKTLYYQHSKSAAQELSRKISCVGCEG